MPGIIPPGASAGTPNAATNPEITFVNEVASKTGLDPRVVNTWVEAEGAYAPNGTGGFNFLNLRPYGASDVGVVGVSSGGFDRFGNVSDAVASTVARIQQPFLQGELAPVLKAGGNPGAQLQAIALSGWDAGHYVGTYQGKREVGGKLYTDFTNLYGASALGGAPETKPLPEAGGGASSDQTSASGVFSGILGGVEGWLTNSGKTVLAYLLLIGVAAGLFIGGLKGLGIPTPKLPAAVPVPA